MYIHSLVRVSLLSRFKTLIRQTNWRKYEALKQKEKKKKRLNNQMVKKRIDTHLLYTCKYFSNNLLLDFKIQIIIEILTKQINVKTKKF